MRFLRKNDIKKTVLVISDIHLGAGAVVLGRRNYLEDFHCDEELVDFFGYHSKGEYLNREVEVIINGDFLDFLAVPFIGYFDDEFWSEEAALEKLKMILKAHPEVIDALGKFLEVKKKKVTYLIGNHDAEFAFESMRKLFIEALPEKARNNFSFILDVEGEYRPHPQVVLKHGHEYEVAHQFSLKECIVEEKGGRLFFIPPWGSYYVTRVINKFKEERGHINAVRPVKKFLINGLIYDTLFTLRFMLATVFYFLMVRIIEFVRAHGDIGKIVRLAANELELFGDYETLTKDYFSLNPDVKALIVGHTHEPIFRPYSDGTTFVNTGTWTRMFNLDFGKVQGHQLTYAQVDVLNDNKDISEFELSLNLWKGTDTSPFEEFGY